MKTFKDANGRDWSITINVPQIKNLREASANWPGGAVDLNGVFDGKLLSRLAENIEVMVNSLFVLCKNQAEAAKISDTQFGESLVGDMLGKAIEAFEEELCDFFPSARRRLLIAAKDAGRRMQASVVDQAVAAIAAEEAKITSQSAPRRSNEESGNGPVSQVLTPENTAAGN